MNALIEKTLRFIDSHFIKNSNHVFHFDLKAVIKVK